MPDDLMNYNGMVQTALRTVVKAALERVVEEGLPGEHHFYIAFDTQHEGVLIPPHLMEQYPEEMTVVLQHQFGDLTVEEDTFEVSLNFNQIPSTLRIPYASLTGFFDPSVQFGLQFQAHDQKSEEAPAPETVSANIEDATANESQAPEAARNDDESEDEEAANKSADVVSLDTFRKK